MTCKDCIHYDPCWMSKYIETNGYCPDFKDKSRYIELPEKVYQTDGVRVYESTVKNVIYETDGVAFDKRAIGQSVFLTREEAEKELEEREANNERP